jgi:hypothetical protein
MHIKQPLFAHMAYRRFLGRDIAHNTGARGLVVPDRDVGAFQVVQRDGLDEARCVVLRWIKSSSAEPAIGVQVGAVGQPWCVVLEKDLGSELGASAYPDLRID